MQRINITLPDDLIRDFKRSIPNGKRSKFIADVLDEKLKKVDLKSQLKKSAQAQQKIIREIQEDFRYADAEIWEKLP